MASQLYHSVMPSGGDFTGLDACMDHLAASHSNLVSSDVYADVEIKGDWSATSDTLFTYITGITTDATHYVNVYTDSANWPLRSGWTTNRYQLTISNDNALNIRVQYCYINGLQIESYGNSANSQNVIAVQIIAAGGSYHGIYNCRLRLANNNGVTSNVIALSDGDVTNWDIYNCICYGRSDNAGNADGLYLAGAGTAGDYNVYNSIVYNCRRGMRYVTNDKIALYDTCIFNCTTDFYATTNWYVVDYCAHDDSAVTGETNEVSESGGGAAWPDDYTDAANGDFNLVAASNLIGAGGGQIVTDLGVTTDIQGTTRADDDLGATAYITGGQALPPLAMNSYRQRRT